MTAAASERSASTQVSQPTSTTTAFLSVYPVPLPPKALVALAMMPRVSSEEGFCPSFFLSFSRCSLLHFLPFYSSQLPPHLSASLSLFLYPFCPFLSANRFLVREREKETEAKGRSKRNGNLAGKRRKNAERKVLMMRRMRERQSCARVAKASTVR